MICLDSDCIIDFLKGKKDAVSVIEKYKEEIVTTQISAFEVFFGVYKKKEVSENEENAARSFFGSLDILEFSEGCGEEAAKILARLVKEGKIIDQNDVLIGSSIIVNGCEKIITKNEKHFSRIEGIEVIGY